MERFILSQFDAVGLGHNCFTPEALGLIVRSAEGVIIRARNLCVSCLLEAVRARTKTVDLDIVNLVLLQPHWRNEREIDASIPNL